MKSLISVIVSAALLSACSSQQSPVTTVPEWATQRYTYADSTALAVVSFDVTLPQPADSATAVARQSLLAALAQQVASDFNAEALAAGLDTLQPFSADTAAASFVAYYGRQIHSLYQKLATAETDTQRHNIEAAIAETDSTDTLALKIYNDELESLGQPSPWRYALSCTAGDTTATYAVYDMGGYAENGGTHGHALSARYFLIDKTSGTPLSRFFADGAETHLQPLLRKGLVDYFNSEGDGGITERTLFSVLSLPKAGSTVIPLPQRTPVVRGDSLLLVYGEEEITPHGYAEPTVVLSVGDAKSCLTPEALRLLGIEGDTNHE